VSASTLSELGYTKQFAAGIVPKPRQRICNR